MQLISMPPLWHTLLDSQRSLPCTTYRHEPSNRRAQLEATPDVTIPTIPEYPATQNRQSHGSIFHSAPYFRPPQPST